MPEIIEVKGTGFTNKGAELMLHAVVGEVRRRLPGAELVVTPTGAATPFAKRGALGLSQKLWYQRLGIQWGRLGGCIPREVRSRYGIRLDSELDAVLDASGLAYSDACSEASMRATARAARHWRRSGTAHVLLPQAFGPFSLAATRQSVTRIVSDARLVFARDPESYRQLVALVGESPRIRQAPDITLGIAGRSDPRHDGLKGRVCIVPNVRMLDRTDPQMARLYIPFLLQCIRLLDARGARPFFLIHEGREDEQIAAECARAIPTEVVREEDPLVLKGLIGNCAGMIGSRFHGLVSALSQGVPALAVGWSHKYEMLFSSFGFPQGIMNLTDDEAMVGSRMSLLLDSPATREISVQLQARAHEQRGELAAMWDSVFEAIR